MMKHELGSQCCHSAFLLASSLDLLIYSVLDMTLSLLFYHFYQIHVLYVLSRGPCEILESIFDIRFVVLVGSGLLQAHEALALVYIQTDTALKTGYFGEISLHCLCLEAFFLLF